MITVCQDDGWGLVDELCSCKWTLLSAAKAYPLGCRRLRVPNRSAMNAIFLFLRSGMQCCEMDIKASAVRPQRTAIVVNV